VGIQQSVDDEAEQGQMVEPRERPAQALLGQRRGGSGSGAAVERQRARVVLAKSDGTLPLDWAFAP
jgi:hypothetical protein